MKTKKSSSAAAKKNISALEKKRFILTIGDEGAILTYARGAKLELRVFATLASPTDLQNLQGLLAADTKAPIHVLIDVMDQTYQQQSLPGVSAFSINKLVTRRLERDYAADDIKGSIQLGRAKTGRKDWDYLFAACPMASPVSDWLDFVMELPNEMTGIYFLPIETEFFIKRLNNYLFTDKTKQRSSWQIFISHNKVSGFRQIAFKDGRMIFTRLIHPSNETVADIIAGSIEQELLNSIEYLKRLALKDNDPFDVFIVVSQDIKFSLQSSDLPGNNVVIMTPHEASKNAGFKNLASQEDRFADVILAVSMVQQRPALALQTKMTQLVRTMQLTSKWAFMILVMVVPILLALMGYKGYNFYVLHDETQKIESEHTQIQKQWQNVQKTQHTIEDMSKISDVIALYNVLAGGGYSPLNLIADFNLVKGNHVLVKSIAWRLKEAIPNKRRRTQQYDTIVATFEVRFFNSGSGFESLFNSFDSFIERLRKKFWQYDVEYSRLPKKINIEQKSKMIPVRVTIAGPKTEYLTK